MGIKLGCKVRVKNNFKNFHKIEKSLPKITANSIEEILENIRGYAIKLEKRS